MTRNVLEEMRSLRHTAECAIGARAETRGQCNCGAADRAPAWAIRILRDNDATGRPLIAIDVPAALDWIEVCALETALHEVQIRTAAIRIKRHEKTTKPTKNGKD